MPPTRKQLLDARLLIILDVPWQDALREAGLSLAGVSSRGEAMAAIRCALGDHPADLRHRSTSRPMDLDDPDQSVEIAAPAERITLDDLGRATFYKALDGPFAGVRGPDRMRLALRVARVVVATVAGRSQAEIQAKLEEAGDPVSLRTVQAALQVAGGLEMPSPEDVYPPIPEVAA